MIGEDDCGAIGGMKIGRGNRNISRKCAPEPLFPPQITHDENPGRRVGEPATNRLSYGAASVTISPSPYAIESNTESYKNSVPKKGKSHFCGQLSNLKIASPAPIATKWRHGTAETVDRNSKILVVGITRNWPKAGGRYPKLKRAWRFNVYKKRLNTGLKRDHEQFKEKFHSEKESNERGTIH
jgi:hypothetical protein